MGGCREGLHAFPARDGEIFADSVAEALTGSTTKIAGAETEIVEAKVQDSGHALEITVDLPEEAAGTLLQPFLERSVRHSLFTPTEDVKTPSEWSALLNLRVLDPDGWRDKCGDLPPRPFEEPITRAEFDARAQASTLVPATWGRSA